MCNVEGEDADERVRVSADRAMRGNMKLVHRQVAFERWKQRTASHDAIAIVDSIRVEAEDEIWLLHNKSKRRQRPHNKLTITTCCRH